MNSEYGKKFSLDEITDMNQPTLPETTPTVQISAEEWESITLALRQMQTLADKAYRQKTAAEAETKVLSETAHRSMQKLNEAAKNSMRKLTETYTELVGKASEKAASRIEKRTLLDDLLWGLRLALMALPTVLVLGLAVYLGWLR